MKWGLILFLWVFSALGFAGAEVIFLEVTNSKGEAVLLEPDFPYAHVLFKTSQGYLHSHPRTGVSFLKETDLEKFGKYADSFYVEHELDWGAVEKYLGKPYDNEFSWGNEKFYCSELVGKLLGMAPEPMHFDPELWPSQFQQYEGKPGISPGKIYRALKKGWGFSFR